MPGRRPPPGPHVVVSHAAAVWYLVPGQGMTFGRARDQQIRFAREPVDDRVSRRAGVLECRSGGLLVTNRSATAIVLRSFPGPDVPIGPGRMYGSTHRGRMAVVVPGGLAEYVISLDTTALGPADGRAEGGSEAPAGSGASVGTSGFERLELSRRERRLLAALCLWTLTRSGPRAVVPTSAQVAGILREAGWDVTDRAVQNQLTELRARLTDEHGVPGLVDPADRRPGPRNYLPRLAEWAVSSGNVTDEDLEDLDEDGRDAGA